MLTKQALPHRHDLSRRSRGPDCNAQTLVSQLINDGEPLQGAPIGTGIVHNIIGPDVTRPDDAMRHVTRSCAPFLGHTPRQAQPSLTPHPVDPLAVHALGLLASRCPGSPVPITCVLLDDGSSLLRKGAIVLRT
jgi:hypothetical protein